MDGRGWGRNDCGPRSQEQMWLVRQRDRKSLFVGPRRMRAPTSFFLLISWIWPPRFGVEGAHERGLSATFTTASRMPPRHPWLTAQAVFHVYI